MIFAAWTIRREQVANLLIVAVLFGAIWDFGAASLSSAMFWLPLQLICAGVVGLLAARRPTAPKNPWVWVMLAVFAGLVAWSAVPLVHPITGPDGSRVSPMDSYGLVVELGKLAGLAGLFFCGFRQGADSRAGAGLLRLLVWGCALYALWAIAAFAEHPETVHGVTKQLHAERLTGSFFSANTAGGLFGAVACLGGIRLMRDGRRLIQDLVDFGYVERTAWLPVLFDGLAVIALWSALLLTVSRTAILVSSALLLVFGLVEGWTLLKSVGGGRAKVLLLAGCGAGAAVLIASVVGSQLVVDKLAALQDDIGGRAQITSAFVPLLKTTPMFGHGLGGFASLNLHTITPDKAKVLWDLGAAHNLVLQWWLEAGLGGLLLGTALMLLVLGRLAWLGAMRDSQRWRARAALGAALVLLLHSLVDFPLEIDGVAALCAVVMGLGCARPGQTQPVRSPPVIASHGEA